MTDDTSPKPASGRHRLGFAAALVAACAAGAGAATLAQKNRAYAVVPLAPAPIEAMKARNPVAIKGQVSDVFGDKFVVQDDSGRALVETGPGGEGRDLVARSETVTVQGRFERGSVHAVAIQHADGRLDVVGPPGPPPGLLTAFVPRPERTAPAR